MLEASTFSPIDKLVDKTPQGHTFGSLRFEADVQERHGSSGVKHVTLHAMGRDLLGAYRDMEVDGHQMSYRLRLNKMGMKFRLAPNTSRQQNII